jgi:hypothetical protein
LRENANTETERFFGEKSRSRYRRRRMRRVRLTGVLLGICGAMALGVSPASAASPRQIYDDYVAHGKLTHHYSQADLQRALQSTMLKGYTHGHGPGMQTHIKTQIPSKGGLPFTGMDLGLITAGAILLLAFGASLRRFARAKA